MPEDFDGEILVIFGLGELLVPHVASSVESLDTSCGTVPSDSGNLFPSKSNTEQFETIVTDSGSEISVPSLEKQSFLFHLVN